MSLALLDSVEHFTIEMLEYGPYPPEADLFVTMFLFGNNSVELKFVHY